MIVSFTCSNFRSIKDEMTLSFEPTSDKVKETSQVFEIVPGVHLLRMAIIHGANASGKTNILRALEFLTYIWRKEPVNKNESIRIIPFKFQEDTNKNSSFELVCYVEGIKMKYAIELNSKEVVSESLYYYSSVQPSNAFTRTIVDGISEIHFPKNMKVSPAVKEALTVRCLPNCSVISAYGQINAKIKMLDEFEKWTQSKAIPLITSNTSLNKMAKKILQSSPKIKPIVLDFLKEADFNIVNYTCTENEIEIPDRVYNLFEYATEIADTEEERERLLKESEKIPNTVYDLELTHEVVNEDDSTAQYTLDEQLQSAGTNRLLGFTVLLISMIMNKSAICIDEIESSLHPFLLYYYIRRFLETTDSPTQMIVTTHYDGLLNQTSWIDKDLFWFTEKKKDGSTDLYSLSEFKGLNRMSIQKAYLSGNFGAIPEIDY